MSSVYIRNISPVTRVDVDALLYFLVHFEFLRCWLLCVSEIQYFSPAIQIILSRDKPLPEGDFDLRVPLLYKHTQTHTTHSNRLAVSLIGISRTFRNRPGNQREPSSGANFPSDSGFITPLPDFSV